jgi:hypothetical protein
MVARLQKAFDKFHDDNPVVYLLVDRFTWQTLDAGHQHYSIASIIERVRWHTNVETKSDDGFKIANAHRAYYARLWMKKNPEHNGFFRLAELRSLDADEEDERYDPHAEMLAELGHEWRKKIRERKV